MLLPKIWARHYVRLAHYYSFELYGGPQGCLMIDYRPSVRSSSGARHGIIQVQSMPIMTTPSLLGYHTSNYNVISEKAHVVKHPTATTIRKYHTTVLH